MSVDAPAPGTYRVADRSAVDFSEALEAWTSAAVAVLTARARTYGATVGYGDLARALFARSGIATRMVMPQWIGDVLARVADVCADPGNDHPPLTALVVRAEDGTVGAGYADAVERTTGTRPADVEQHAAEARLACYRALARDLPADGGSPVVTARVAAGARATGARSGTRAAGTRAARPSAPAAPPPPVAPRCPTCHMELPRSGQCDTCD